jgi:hypothetical protein
VVMVIVMNVRFIVMIVVMIVVIMIVVVMIVVVMIIVVMIVVVMIVVIVIVMVMMTVAMVHPLHKFESGKFPDNNYLGIQKVALTGIWTWSSPKTKARITFTTTPIAAIVDISFPLTWNASPPTYRIIHNRCVASTAKLMDKITKHTIEKRAARLSVRLSPKLCDADAGRLAMWKPIMATRNAERSAARCAASDKTARDPAKIMNTKKREWFGGAYM